MTRRFTGWHMLALMLGFFGLILAVNITMARYAVSTFGGQVVENTYVASQRFNGWLSSARAQRMLGWRVVSSVDAAGLLHVTPGDASGTIIEGRVRVVARHPLGRLPDQTLALRRVEGGYVADQPLPGGRWLLHIDVRAQGHEAHFADQVQA